MDQAMAKALQDIAKVVIPDEYCLFWVQTLCMPRTEWAAWTGAVGAVLAILGSALVVYFQHSLQQKAERLRGINADFTSLQEVVAVIRLAQARLEWAKGEMDRGLKVKENDFTEVVMEYSVVRDLPLTVVPHPVLQAALRKSQFAASNLSNVMTRQYGKLRNGVPDDLSGDDLLWKNATKLLADQYKVFDIWLTMYAREWQGKK